ncbi:protein MpBELL1 [Marchantia polymorpha subsp. ruderalis]|uniref:Homeobox domain-containing protein n=1 Tax=Marchantia polymorpha TaxID=3197 RepID=A0A2R6W049_MARPO|nr:hypothetical protein MARPO_0213s0014 [Marchantia polymorpha]BBN20333.1 hypothetical protein Mp_8g18310 [Marchantia polymorpha subsp. ruderalis]|eukprot:PTQ27220.1 hypothetical protein MARPO_0213s0014 [Marchantia polymorpha]
MKSEGDPDALSERTSRFLLTGILGEKVVPLTKLLEDITAESNEETAYSHLLRKGKATPACLNQIRSSANRPMCPAERRGSLVQKEGHCLDSQTHCLDSQTESGFPAKHQPAKSAGRGGGLPTHDSDHGKRFHARGDPEQHIHQSQEVRPSITSRSDAREFQTERKVATEDQGRHGEHQTQRQPLRRDLNVQNEGISVTPAAHQQAGREAFQGGCSTSTQHNEEIHRKCQKQASADQDRGQHINAEFLAVLMAAHYQEAYLKASLAAKYLQEYQNAKQSQHLPAGSQKAHVAERFSEAYQVALELSQLPVNPESQKSLMEEFYTNLSAAPEAASGGKFSASPPTPYLHPFYEGSATPQGGSFPAQCEPSHGPLVPSSPLPSPPTGPEQDRSDSTGGQSQLPHGLGQTFLHFSQLPSTAEHAKTVTEEGSDRVIDERDQKPAERSEVFPHHPHMSFACQGKVMTRGAKVESEAPFVAIFPLYKPPPQPQPKPEPHYGGNVGKQVVQETGDHARVMTSQGPHWLYSSGPSIAQCQSRPPNETKDARIQREQEAPPGTQGVGSERETYCDGSDGKRSTGFKRWSAPQNGDGRAQNPIQFAVANQAPQGDGPPHQRAPPHPLTFVDLGDASEDGESVQTPLPEDKESDSEPESERFAGQPRDEDTEVGARVERNVEESKSGAETLQESGDDDAGELEDEEREREGEGEGEVKSERRFYFFDFTKICDNLYPPDVTTKMLKDFGLRYYPMRFREDEKIREIEALFREVLSFSRPKNVPEIPIVPFDFLRSQRYFTEMAQRPAARKSASARSSQSTAAGTSHPAAQLWAALIAQRARAFRRECSIRIENQGIDLADSFTADQLDYKPVHRGRSRDVMAWLRKPRSRGVTLHDRKKMFRAYIDEIDDWYYEYRSTLENINDETDDSFGHFIGNIYTEYPLMELSRRLRRYRDTFLEHLVCVKKVLGDSTAVPDFDKNIRDRLIACRVRAAKRMARKALMVIRRAHAPYKKRMINGCHKMIVKLEPKQENRIAEAVRIAGTNNGPRRQQRMYSGRLNLNSTWRPQRGLPDRAVSVLKAWLFTNFLHPYPKDVDKESLASATGLTRSQVSNWFINARVRVWKPMIEAMYLMDFPEDRHRFITMSRARKVDHGQELGDRKPGTSRSRFFPCVDGRTRRSRKRQCIYRPASHSLALGSRVLPSFLRHAQASSRMRHQASRAFAPYSREMLAQFLRNASVWRAQLGESRQNRAEVEHRFAIQGRAEVGNRFTIQNRTQVEPKFTIQNRAQVEPRLTVQDRAQVESRFPIQNRAQVEPRLIVQDRAQVEPRFPTQNRAQVEPRVTVQDRTQVEHSFIIQNQGQVEPRLTVQDRDQVETRFPIQNRAQVEPSVTVQDRAQVEHSFISQNRAPVEPRFTIQDRAQAEPKFTFPSQAKVEPRLTIQDRAQLEPRFTIQDRAQVGTRFTIQDRAPVETRFSIQDRAKVDTTLTIKDLRAELEPRLTSEKIDYDNHISLELQLGSERTKARPESTGPRLRFQDGRLLSERMRIGHHTEPPKGEIPMDILKFEDLERIRKGKGIVE